MTKKNKKKIDRSADRKIDVENLTDEQLQIAIDAISKKVKLEIEATIARINGLVSRYGLTCKLQASLEAVSPEVKEEDSK